MSLLTWIVLFCLFGGALSVMAAAIFLFLGDAARARLLPHFVSFATGALLGAAFLGLLPEALASQSEHAMRTITATVLGGIVGFFLLEKMLLWRHCHTEHCEAHDVADSAKQRPAGILILVGDALHNFVDGILIAAAFMTDIRLGVVTSLATAAHEIPQEIGDFAILLHSGLRPVKALAFNILASLSTVVGGLLAYFSLTGMRGALPYVLALATSSFIYIAVADLIPGLHKHLQPATTAKQLTSICLGIAVIYAGQTLVH